MFHYVVGDFNTAEKQLVEQSRGRLATDREVENPTWLAPEILRRQPLSAASDVYGFASMPFISLLHTRIHDSNREIISYTLGACHARTSLCRVQFWIQL